MTRWPGAREGATDEQLMRRVRETEDVQAFDCLYDRHATRAYRLARSVCGGARRSEDAVRDGFLAIWRAGPNSVRGTGPFEPGR